MDMRFDKLWVGMLLLLLSMVCAFAFVQIYKSEREAIKEIEIPSNAITVAFPGDDLYKTWLDSFSLSDGTVSAEGWAMKVGDNMLSSYVNSAFLLKSEENVYYKVKTVKVTTSSVTNYFADGTDYSNAGFQAWGSMKNLPKGKYQACLLFIEKDGTAHLFVYDQYVEW